MEAQVSATGTSGPVGKKMKSTDITEYDTLVHKLAELLNIATHPDTSVTIKAARLLIERILSDRIESGDTNNREEMSSLNSLHASKRGYEIRIQQSKFDLNDVSLPTTVEFSRSKKCNSDDKKDDPNEAYCRAARSLKLLYLDDQKQLQLKVNEIISTIQSITANPKTDSKLLSTGR